MNRFNIDILDAELKRALKRLGERVSPSGMRVALAEIGSDLAESTRRRFTSSTGADGSRWAGLAKSTMMSRLYALGAFSKKTGRLTKKGAAAAASMKPLVETGELSRFIRYQVVDGGASVVIGTNRTFDDEAGVGAEVHQFGTRTIPARPFLGIDEQDKATILDILNRHLSDAANQ
ncbi:MAG: phage virion morphogenesis protein [Azoarcus sp.]|jgi:phage gpG-like protein|nr:phage virion morphogenesis protein [Azoarcus sp.]